MKKIEGQIRQHNHPQPNEKKVGPSKRIMNDGALRSTMSVSHYALILIHKIMFKLIYRSYVIILMELISMVT